MTQRPLRVLFVSSHPVQYASPLFRLFAKDPRLEIQVAYCSLEGAEPAWDPDFGVEVKWDIPLLDGYPWVLLPNRGGPARIGSFFGHFNPAIWQLIRRGNFDAVLLFTGYIYATFWLAIGAAKVKGTRILFGTDATSLKPRDGKRWKLVLKKLSLPAVFRLADVITIPSEAGRQFMRSLGISESQIALTPFVVDNRWWQRRAAEVDRSTVRRLWNIPEEASVALFCAKLQPWKRPQEALRGFARANVKGAYLVIAGDGPLRVSLEAEAKSLGIADRIRFLGFINQTGLPSVYRSADLFVLTSEYDPCPVVVCEAMLCGCPVVLSDEIRGRYDLVKDGETGFLYPSGNIEALAEVLSKALGDRRKLNELGAAAIARMETWSPQDNVEGVVTALEKACSRR
jgi:glycosyltransferase involved in cell wall biosynthesis